MGKKNKKTARKNPTSVASGNSSNSRLMQNLKTVNACLVKEVEESRKEIESLRIQLLSLVAEKDILYGIQRDISTLVVSSSLHESASRATMEMTAASEREKILRKKIETVTSKANTEEIQLLALTKEKDEKEKELRELKETIESMEEVNKHGRRRRNFAVLAPFIAAAGSVALVIFWIVFKK